MADLKDVLVKRTIFTKEYHPVVIKQYIINCVSIGSDDTNVLYKNPKITTAFYDEGSQAAIKIADAITLAGKIPLETNKSAIIDRMVDGKAWLDLYAGKVEVIANDPANRTTREQAATNIMASNLTQQKLANAPKGNPEKTKLAGKVVGLGAIDIEILNGVEYNPSQTTIIAIEKSAGGIVTLVNGVLNIVTTNRGQVVIRAASNRGSFTHFTGLNNVPYEIWAYGSNGKKQTGLLSDKITVGE